MDPSDPNSMQPAGARSAAQALGIAFADVPVVGADAIERTFARLPQKILVQHLLEARCFSMSARASGKQR
jgi:hypothetical protein